MGGHRRGGGVLWKQDAQIANITTHSAHSFNLPLVSRFFPCSEFIKQAKSPCFVFKHGPDLPLSHEDILLSLPIISGLDIFLGSDVPAHTYQVDDVWMTAYLRETQN